MSIMPTITRKLAPLALALALGAAPAWATETADIGSDRAVELARAAAPGRVLDVQRNEESSPPRYEVKILQDDGHVRTIRIAVETGEQL